MKSTKNRLLIAVLCIVLAGVLMVIYSFAVKSEAKKTEIVRVTAPIQKGQVITQEQVKLETVGGYNLPENVLQKTDAVVGQYARADFAPGDYVLEGKVAEKLPSVEEKLLNLGGDRVAVSFSIKDFANGVSDKLLSGDIITIYAMKDGKLLIPKELTYVEVLTTTTSSGQDRTSGKGTEEDGADNLATVTVLVTPRQAQLITEYEDNAEIHMTLVYRGDQGQQFLDKQAAVLRGAE